jgi:hypothetical protein
VDCCIIKTWSDEVYKGEEPTPGEEWSEKKSGESEEKNDVIHLFSTLPLE